MGNVETVMLADPDGGHGSNCRDVRADARSLL
jgi:hypothetical protein